MPATYNISVNDRTTLDRAVATIEPHAGSILVTGSQIEPITVGTEEIFDAEGAAGLQVSTTEGAVFEVTYADEGQNQHPQAARGSATAGTTGGYESRTVDDLRREAAEKKIPGRSGMDKDQLIAALRDAE